MTLALITLASGCGGGSDNSSQVGSIEQGYSSQTHHYNYTITLNGITCSTGDQTANSNDEYCALLKNEPANHYCAQSQRYSNFQAVCEPLGYVWPVESPQPTPWPTQTTTPPPATPSPLPTSTPPPATDDRPQVIKDLEAAGIKVRIQPISVSLPGELPFNVRLNRFLTLLEMRKNYFISQRQLFKNIVLTAYASYDTDIQTLTLLVDFPTIDLLDQYLNLCERHRFLESRTQMTFDFGVELYGDSNSNLAALSQELSAFEQRLSSFEQNSLAIKNNLSPIFKKIQLDDSTTYDYFFNQTLKLDRDSPLQGLQQALSYFSELAPFFAFLNTQSIKFTYDGSDFDDNQDNIKQVILSLNQIQSTLSHLKFLGKVNSLKLQKYSSKPYLIGTEVSGINLETLSLTNKSLRVIDDIESFSRPIAIQVDFPYDLTDSFLIAATRIIKNKNLIEQKKSQIKKINFSTSSSYYRGLSQLTVGSDSEAEFLKVLNSI